MVWTGAAREAKLCGDMLVVDPWHWLSKEGEFLTDDPRLYCRMFRIARFIEYGGPLTADEVVVHNWQDTEWACGMMGPVQVDLG
jgi:hypothetical protein